MLFKLLNTCRCGGQVAELQRNLVMEMFDNRLASRYSVKILRFQAGDLALSLIAAMARSQWKPVHPAIPKNFAVSSAIFI